MKKILIVLGVLLVFILFIVRRNYIKININEEDLNKYLSYVPSIEELKIYDKKKTILDDIPEKFLITKILDKELSCWDQENCDFDMHLKLPIKNGEVFYYEGDYVDKYYFPFEYIKNKMEEYYNKDLKNLEETKKIEDVYNATLGFIYQDDYFLSTGGGETSDLFVSYVDSYKASRKELIIYEYAGHYNYFEETLGDYYNNYKVKLDYETDFYNYLKENKEKFTKYKHVFKKNDTGYYWYSTEVV